MTNSISKAIFPIAGLGTRFLPATKSVPKEMITILDRPIIEWAVIEAAKSGIDEMIFVTSSRKNIVLEHFEKSELLEFNLKKKKIELINIYVPNGNPVDTEKYEYKKEWLKKFISSVKKKIQKNSNILIAGDFNIIPEEIDVHDFKRYENDALGRLEIRKKYRELVNLGFKDVYRFKNKTKQEYTFWDYFAGSWQKNYGMRIDHFLLSNSLIENIKSININKKPRSKEKPSDHTPIELEII